MGKKKPIDALKGLKNTAKIILASVVLILIIVMVIIITHGSGEVTVDVESSLKSVFEISDLSTSEYTYNSIAEVKDEDKTKYYVSYKGTIKAGFNFEEITITTKGKITTVTIPRIKITATHVEDDLDFIFLKNKYEHSKVYEEALKACQAHLKQEADTNIELIDTAKENAIETVKALTLPIAEQLEEGHTIEVVVAE